MNTKVTVLKNMKHFCISVVKQFMLILLFVVHTKSKTSMFIHLQIELALNHFIYMMLNTEKQPAGAS